MNIQAHWEKIYKEKNIKKVSWYQPSETTSKQLIMKYSSSNAKVFDCGSGTSTLIDNLLENKYKDITLLDISNSALELVKNRIGDINHRATFIHQNILDFTGSNFDIWHDRAVLHFLTKESDIQKYFEIMTTSVNTGGVAIIATFAPDKSRQCSSLDTKPYDINTIQNRIKNHWKIIENLVENHTTPSGDTQLFNYFCLQKT